MDKVLSQRWQTVLITDVTTWEQWRSAWMDLVTHSTAFEARLFLSYEWLATWWQFLGRGKLLVIGVREGNCLLAAAPLFVAPSSLLPFARLVRFVGNGNSDYGDFLVRQGCEEAATLLWHWLFQHRSLWDAIALHELPETSAALRALRSLQEPPNIGIALLCGEACHRLPLDAKNGHWRQRTRKSLRQQLQRRERQLSRLFTVEFRAANTPEEVAQSMKELFTLHRLRWGQLGQTGVFFLPKVRQFHLAFAQEALRQGWLRLHRLVLDGKTAAVYYAFCWNGYAGFYSCGFHPAFARYSVGKVLLAKVIDEAEANSARCFDFMRGNETYKADFGTVVAHNRHLFVWQTDKPLSRLAAALHRLATKLSLGLKESLQR